jgi:Fur family peroxide stress response transcriptional regulator
MGEVVELSFSGDDNRYNGNKPHPHPHLVCVRCRRIVAPQAESVQSLEREVTDLSGYQIVGHRLDFYGICPDCQSSG